MFGNNNVQSGKLKKRTNKNRSKTMKTFHRKKDYHKLYEFIHKFKFICYQILNILLNLLWMIYKTYKAPDKQNLSDCF